MLLSSLPIFYYLQLKNRMQLTLFFAKKEPRLTVSFSNIVTHSNGKILSAKYMQRLLF